LNVIGGSVGVGEAFGLTGVALGFSTGTAGLVSCAEETCPMKKKSAPSAMNLRKSMKKEAKAKTCVYLAEPTCNASRRRLNAKGAETSRANDSQSRYVSRHNPQSWQLSC
jgi:hypothetical protein